MGHRLVIVTEIIAPYRIPVFNALAARGAVDLHVVFLADTDPSLRQWRVYKDEICFSYQVLPSWRARLGNHTVLLNRGLAAALRAASPEVIVCGGYSYLASWQTLWWARKKNRPLLLWSESNARDMRSHNTVVEFVKRRFVKSCYGFVVPGRSSLDYLRQLGVRSQPIFTAPNAVDNELFSRLAASARQNGGGVRSRYGLPDRFFLYVGRLVPNKGVFELLAAYEALEDCLREQIGLVFVGDGAARSELLERANKVRPGRIQSLGFVHRDQLPGFYALAEALVFPTHSDPWGLVVNEAMACGLPVISTDVAGCAADLVEDGCNGFVIPARQVSPLAHAMHKLATQPELRAQMSSRSWHRIQAYSPASWAEGMAEAVNRSVARPV